MAGGLASLAKLCGGCGGCDAVDCRDQFRVFQQPETVRLVRAEAALLLALSEMKESIIEYSIYMPGGVWNQFVKADVAVRNLISSVSEL